MAAIAILVAAGCAPARSTRVTRYPSGGVHWTVATVDGVPHGLSKTFHPNGQLASRGRYERGIRVGTFVHFDERGHFVRRVAYLDGIAVWTGTTEDAEPPADLEALRPAPPIKPPPPPIAGATFATLDRASTTSALDAQLGVHAIPSSDGLGRRLDLGAQYRLGRYSAYGHITASDVSMSGDRVAGKTSVELGGLAHRSLPWLELTLRGGVIVPLANDDLDGFISSAATAYQRLGDVAATYPETVPLRLSASATRARSWWFVGVDVGVDTLVSTSSGDERVGVGGPVSVLGRANLGLGVGTGRSTLALELANVGLLGETGAEFERFAHVASLVARSYRWPVHPTFGFSYPFSSGTNSKQIAVFVGVGVPLDPEER